MIFLTEQLLKDNETFLNLIDDEIALVNASLKSQKALKNSLLDHMQESATTTKINTTNSSKILNVLSSYKNSLELSKNNITSLEHLLNLLNDIKKMDNDSILNKMSELNLEIMNTNENLAKNEQEILQTLKITIDSTIEENNNNSDINNTEATSTIEKVTENNIANTSEEVSSQDANSNESSSTETISQDNNSIENTSLETTSKDNNSIESTSDETISQDNNSIENDSVETTSKDNNSIENDSIETTSKDNSSIENTSVESKSQNNTYDANTSTGAFSESISIQENTLIISEKAKKVFLPYNVSSLETLYKNNPNKYSCIEDIIRKDYTLPLENFKIPSLSRFRESFKLMKEKENKSFKESFDLALELFFNYNLHPAIISACKNLDELDIYLDYLSSNETHKFNCFNVVFEVAPVAISKHSMRRKLD